jgi:hypothetical protein
LATFLEVRPFQPIKINATARCCAKFKNSSSPKKETKTMPRLVASGLSKDAFDELVHTPVDEVNAAYGSSTAANSFDNTYSEVNFPVRDQPSLALQFDAAVRKVKKYECIFSCTIFLCV